MLRVGVLAVALIATAQLAQQARADSITDVVAVWDQDHDRTLDLTEIDRAAGTEFDKLDVDHDATLDMKELGRRVTKAEFLAADKDKDGTLDKAEYVSIVAARFHVVDRDNDATIEAKELQTAAGRHLMKLLRWPAPWPSASRIRAPPQFRCSGYRIY